MKQYYIHRDGSQLGPFTLAELQGQNINRSTMVWCQGMDNWQEAGTVDELATAFATPPPLQAVPAVTGSAPPMFAATPPPATFTEEEAEPARILGIPRKHFFIACGLMLAVVIFSILQLNRNAAEQKYIEQVQHAQQEEKLQQQQQLLEEQNARIAEQERLERERVAREKEAARQARIAELSTQMTITANNLQAAEKRLNAAHEFQFLRSGSEKRQQVAAAENEVATYTKQLQDYQDEYFKLTNGTP